MTVLTRERDMATGGRPSVQTQSWFEAATRAHAILTQSLPDELLEQVSTGDAAPHTPFKVALLVG